MGDPQRGQMEDGIGTPHEIPHQLAVADVAIDQRDRAWRAAAQVLGPAADHVVDHDDLAAAGSTSRSMVGVPMKPAPPVTRILRPEKLWGKANGQRPRLGLGPGRRRGASRGR